jgi:hypothetical protein
VIYLLLEDNSVLEAPIDDLPAHTPNSPISERVYEMALRHSCCAKGSGRMGSECARR